MFIGGFFQRAFNTTSTLPRIYSSNTSTLYLSDTMILEETRFLHEDLERLEQGIADRTAEEPRHVSDQHYPLDLDR